MSHLLLISMFISAAQSEYGCDLIENASVQLPGIAYQWDYPLPINVCMSAYQNNGNQAPFYSSEIFQCSSDGNTVTYSYYNGSADCDEAALEHEVNAYYSSFECGNDKPCAYASIKTYFQDASNASDWGTSTAIQSSNICDGYMYENQR